MANDFFLTRKNQKIRKSTLLHSLFLTQCLDNVSLCNLKIFLCISIEKREPRNIPRSRPSASTSKRTLASIFQSWYTRKFSNYTWTIFPNTSSRQCVKERTILFFFAQSQKMDELVGQTSYKSGRFFLFFWFDVWNGTQIWNKGVKSDFWKTPPTFSSQAIFGK